MSTRQSSRNSGSSSARTSTCGRNTTRAITIRRGRNVTMMMTMNVLVPLLVLLATMMTTSPIESMRTSASTFDSFAFQITGTTSTRASTKWIARSTSPVRTTFSTISTSTTGSTTRIGMIPPKATIARTTRPFVRTLTQSKSSIGLGELSTTLAASSLSSSSSSSSSSASLNPDSSVSVSTDNNNYFDDWYNTTDTTALQYGYIADRCRVDFPILERTCGETLKSIIYLDSAATSQKPMYVIDAIEQYYTQSNANVHRGAHTLSREATDAYETARTTVQQFINASSRNEIIFTSGATDGINLLAHIYGRGKSDLTSLYNIEPGDEIILTVAEHHSNIVPWQILAAERNITIHYIDIIDSNDGIVLNWSQLDTLLHPTKTKLVAFQHVSNVLGNINPVQEIVHTIRSKAPYAKILLDACQSIPHMSINVQQLDIDFLVASSHKMCGPTGIGFLYGKEVLLNSMTPSYKSGGEMIDTVTLSGSTYLPCPARYEAGTPPIAQAIGLAAAINYLTNYIGMDNIEKYEHELGLYAYKQLRSTIPELQILGPQLDDLDNDDTTTTTTANQRVALCTFYHPLVHPSDIATFLDLEGIAIRAGHHCCQPLHTRLGISHSARASFYFYNTKEEVDFFVQELKKTIDFFTSIHSDNDSDDAFVPFV